jgi:TonB family protein
MPPEPKFEDAVRPGLVSPAKPAVTVNVFFEGSSAKPTLNLSAKQVQTGGFGDPDGAAGQPIPAKAGNIAQLGSFDLPGGPGYGNGAGGARGAHGMVASASFGNGVAGDGGALGRHSTVRQGSFGDSRPAAETPRAARPKPMESPTTPIEIISKPRPVYTEKARRLKLEGEVLLDVLFGASGQPRVMTITRGLGHGLDEAAVRAAEQIQYRPARRDGQPVDYRATVHIVFQLAY